MVATPDLGSGAERRGGSSPFIRTSTEQISLLGFRLIKKLGQLVAVWHKRLSIGSSFFVRLKALGQFVAPRLSCLLAASAAVQVPVGKEEFCFFR